MPDLSQLLNEPSRSTGTRGTNVLRGIITKPPASADDAIEVVAPSYTAQAFYEVPAGHWTPRGSALPLERAECLLVMDEVGDAYMPVYQGANAFGSGGSSGGGDDDARLDVIESGTYWDQGDTLSYGSVPYADGLMLRISKGTVAAPDRSLGSLIYVSRTMDHRVSDISGSKQEALAGIVSIVYGVPTNEQQPVAGYFMAKQAASTNPGGTSDAIGVQGGVRMLPGSVGSGIGTYITARMDSSSPTAKANSSSVVVQNYSGADIAYSAGGVGSRLNGLSFQPGGTNKSGAGIVFYRGSGEPQFDVGIGAPSDAFASAFIRDDSNAPTSIDINGSHTVGLDLTDATFNETAIKVGSGEEQNYISLLTKAQHINVAGGTAAVPDRIPNPLVKISRLSDHRIADVAAGAPDEQLAALLVINAGTVNTEKQPTAIKGISKTKATSQYADACGIAGSAYLEAGAGGAGEGGFYAARMDSTNPTARIYGIEVQVQNATGAPIAYQATGWGRAEGVVISGGGSATYQDAGSAIKIVRSASDSARFEVGIGFPSGPGAGGAITGASIRDDSTSPIVLDVNGAHGSGLDFSGATFTGNAIKLAAGDATTGIDFGGMAALYGAGNALATAAGFSARSLTVSGGGGNGFLVLPQQTADPAAATTTTARVFAKAAATNVTGLMARFDSGNVAPLAIEGKHGLVTSSTTAATALGTLSKKVELFDATGASAGFIPVYTTIT